MAALQAKKDGDIESAKEYLRKAKVLGVYSVYCLTGTFDNIPLDYRSILIIFRKARRSIRALIY